jgi:electron transport complex protein RnfB
VTPQAARIHAALPQTQCTRCGYPDCERYAEAIAGGKAAINQCPPGGAQGIARLAQLTGQAALPLDAARGVEAPRTVAVIDENWCIGCTLCIDACPVDAILGAPKQMHVIMASLCSGCELCVAPCPVDCIAMVPAGRAWTTQDADAARTRHRHRELRIARGERVESRGIAASSADAAAQRREAVAAALARARARRAHSPTG